jgi:hypothetical protein
MRAFLVKLLHLAQKRNQLFLISFHSMQCFMATLDTNVDALLEACVAYCDQSAVDDDEKRLSCLFDQVPWNDISKCTLQQCTSIKAIRFSSSFEAYVTALEKMLNTTIVVETFATITYFGFRAPHFHVVKQNNTYSLQSPVCLLFNTFQKMYWLEFIFEEPCKLARVSCDLTYEISFAHSFDKLFTPYQGDGARSMWRFEFAKDLKSCGTLAHLQFESLSVDSEEED